jgi:hypothetical protein
MQVAVQPQRRTIPAFGVLGVCPQGLGRLPVDPVAEDVYALGGDLVAVGKRDAAYAVDWGVVGCRFV